MWKGKIVNRTRPRDDLDVGIIRQISKKRNKIKRHINFKIIIRLPVNFSEKQKPK